MSFSVPIPHCEEQRNADFLFLGMWISNHKPAYLQHYCLINYLIDQMYWVLITMFQSVCLVLEDKDRKETTLTVKPTQRKRIFCTVYDTGVHGVLSTEEPWPNQRGWLGKAWKKTSVSALAARVLKLEQYRDQHSPCTRMSWKCRKCSTFKKRERKERTPHWS